MLELCAGIPAYRCRRNSSVRRTVAPTKRTGAFVHLISKIDESGTHGASPHMIMAGYTARPNQWNRFDNRWQKALRKAGLEYFHAKEHWRHPFAAKVVKLSDSNLLFGFVAKISERDYKQFYRSGDGWGGKAQPDSIYGLAFRTASHSSCNRL